MNPVGGQGKGRKKKPNVTTDPTVVTVTDDGTRIHGNGKGFAPNATVNFDMRSHAIDNNTSTEGVTAGGYTGSDANGNVECHAPRDFMLPDFPRQVVCTMTDGANTDTGTAEFTS